MKNVSKMVYFFIILGDKSQIRGHVRICEFFYLESKASSMTLFLLSYMRPVLTCKVRRLPAFSAGFSLGQGPEQSQAGSAHPPVNASWITSIQLQNKDIILVTRLLDQTCNRNC